MRWKTVQVIVLKSPQYQVDFTSCCGVDGVESLSNLFQGGDSRKHATNGRFDWGVYTQIGRFSLLRKIAIDLCAIRFTVSAAISRT